WVAPAAGAGAVTLLAVTSAGSGPLALDENPQIEALGFPDGETRLYDNYVAAEDIAGDLPLAFDSSTSLVAAVRRDEAKNGNCGTSAIVGNCVDVYQVVTILDAVPPLAGSRTLRPSVGPIQKELIHLEDLDWSRLPSLDYIPAVDAGEVEPIREKWSHALEIFSIVDAEGESYSEAGRAFRAGLLVPDYGAGTARSFYDHLFSLFSSGDDLTTKEPALAAMLTYGKDLYDAVFDHGIQRRGWGSGAGQHLGKFPPAVFYAAMLRDPGPGAALATISASQVGRPDTYAPQELEQINDGPNGPVWGDAPDVMGRYDVTRYWAEMLSAQCFDGALGECRTSGGRRTTRDPMTFVDGPPAKPGSSYMGVALGPTLAFAALAHLMPRVCAIADYPPLIAYADRIRSIGLQTANDPCAPPDPRENPETCDAFRSRDCEYYGTSNTGTATWGPISLDDLHTCIPNGPGQNGRFPQFHGEDVSVGYKVVVVEDHWDLIRASNEPCSADLSIHIFSDGFESGDTGAWRP
ncbi:MAG: hypothetical protein AAGD06_33225, partial [Acidobacteriota bacterium]